MSVCCIGGVCIPYTAFFPLLLLIVKWLAQKLSSIGLLPESVAKRLNLQQTKGENCCECEKNDTTATNKTISKQLSTKTTTSILSSESSSSSVGERNDGVGKISSEQEWNELLSSDSFIVCKFTATWCVPCKQISPFFEELAANYNATFVEVDVDECDEIAAQYQVAMMPTFMIFHNNKVVNTYRGSNQEKLREFVEQHVK